MAICSLVRNDGNFMDPALKIDFTLPKCCRNGFKIILAHIKYVFVACVKFSEPRAISALCNFDHKMCSSLDKLYSDPFRTRHPNRSRILGFPDFRATLRGCNFDHTCRRLKSSGVFKSRCFNSSISGVLRPIRPDWTTPRG